MTRRKNKYPGVRKNMVKGKIYWKFEAGDYRCNIPGPYGGPEFLAAYEAALNGAKAPATTAVPDTVGWLIEKFLGSLRFQNLSPSRKRSIRAELDWLREIAGKYHFSRLTVQHIEALMSKKAGPVAANTVKKNMSMLFNFASKKLGYTGPNPAKFAEKMKTNPDGYHTWTEDEIAQFLAFHGEGSKPRLACLLILFTGASRQDVARMGWQNVKDGVISYRRGKTRVAADLPIMPDLQAELDHVPADQMIFVTHGRGLPYKAETFGNWFKDQCVLAGLPHCSAHGLRKGAATRLADHGGNEYEVMSLMAHSTPKEGATYTKKANRAKLAASGMAKVYGINPEQNLSNLQGELDRKMRNAE